MISPKRRQFNYESMNQCKRKLFTQPIGQYSHNRVQHIENSTENKKEIFVSQKQTSSKKIKLKRHMKTQISIYPEKLFQKQEKNSSNILQFHIRSPLHHKNTNIQSNTNFSSQQAELIKEISHSKMNHMNTFFSQIDPSPAKKSLGWSQFNKSNIFQRSVSKSEEKSISKSKRKIQFTVFQQKKKSMNTPKLEKLSTNIQTIKKDYAVPYRYNNKITIDLFNPTKHPSQKRSTSKSLNKSLSKDSKSSKRSTFNRTLTKSDFQKVNQERVGRVWEQLGKYKFVGEYMRKWEVVEKMELFSARKEPECRWALLIVDEVFRKMKGEGL